MIYLDSSATTKIDPEVLKEMMPYLTEKYGNAGALYRFGKESSDAIELARDRVAKFLGAKSDQIIFTSSGTEANNMVFYGVKNYLKSIGKGHICVSAVEHDSVFGVANALFGENSDIKDDFYSHVIPVKNSGVVDLEALESILKADDRVGLISVMHMNNETGVVNPVHLISSMCEKYGVLFHTDCVQAASCIPLDVNDIGCDFATISGHKIGAPKGIGALFVKDKSVMQPMIYGGGAQEFGLRGGTQDVPGIVGIGKACEIYAEEQTTRLNVVDLNRGFFYQMLTENMADNGLDDVISVNGDSLGGGHKVLNLRIKNVDSEALVILLGVKNICISSGSACRSHEQVPSRTLTAMGIDPDDARSSIRISFSPDNTVEELTNMANILSNAIKMLITMQEGKDE